MTFRETLMAADLDTVYALIHKRDSGNAAKCDRPSLAQCQFNYSRVVKELNGQTPSESILNAYPR